MTRSKFSLMKKGVLTVALVAATTGVANADDGDMGRFGDSYQYFSSQPTVTARSTYRAQNPNGISERQLQAYSASGASEAWEIDKPVFDTTPSEFRLAQPNGLSEAQLQALSSEAPVWHKQDATGIAAVVSRGQSVVAQTAPR